MIEKRNRRMGNELLVRAGATAAFLGSISIFCCAGPLLISPDGHSWQVNPISVASGLGTMGLLFGGYYMMQKGINRRD